MPNMTDYEMSKNLQDFLICFEMLLAAIAHMYVFSHKQFVNETSGPVPITYSFNRVVDLTDERTDVVDHIRYIGIQKILNLCSTICFIHSNLIIIRKKI